jgi:hypothetical protein
MAQHASSMGQLKPSIGAIPSQEIRQVKGIPDSISDNILEQLFSDSDDHHSLTSISPALANKDFHVTDSSQAQLRRFP